MLYLVIYDITDDGLRRQVSETLKDYGLERVQFSGFLGFLTRNRLRSLVVDLKGLLRSYGGGNEGERRNIQIYPLCNSCFGGKILIGEVRKYWDEKGKKAFVV